MKLHKYLYFYRTTNLINGKIYYGIHRTNNLEDNYLGSGYALHEAIRKYGKIFFKKEILHFFETEKDLLDFEKRIVTEDFIKQTNNYNLAIGGLDPISQQRIDFWNSEQGAKRKKELSEMNSGYKNADFVKRWKPLYDEIINDFCNLVINTNLPDFYILKQIVKTQKFKFNRLLRYAIYLNKIDKIEEQIKYKDYFTVSGSINTFKKTIVANRPNNIQIYKKFNKEIIDSYQSIFNIINDYTISDSMLYNNIINITNSRKFFTTCAYFEYLNLIEKEDKIKINIRNRKNNSQRKTGQKTLFNFNKKFKQNYILIGEDINDKYELNFDGKVIQYSRI